MIRWLIGIAVLLSCFHAAGAQILDGNGDLRNFELTATPPPVPALKYQLLFDPSERTPANAALLYYQAESLINDGLRQDIFDADDASDGGDLAKFDRLAGALGGKSTLALMDLAGRCESCDWGAPIRQNGSATLLPYLNVSRLMATLVKVRAVYDDRHDDVPGALAMIRLDLELGRKIGEEPVPVSGLVGQGIIAMSMGESITELMNRPDSPNLYWALASLPRPLISLQRSWWSERTQLIDDVPELAPAKIDNLSGEQWRAIFERVATLTPVQKDAAPAAWSNPQSVADEVKRTLPAAAANYAQTRHLSQDQVAKLDDFKVVATYWLDQFQAVNDDRYKLTALPYPLAIAKMKESNDQLSHMIKEQPANVFLARAGLNRIATTHARVDRLIAALTAVEAIRSYAAGHDGKLPAALNDVTETPVLDNPMTGKPFDYTVQGDMVTLADPDGDGLPLKYSVKIRK